MQQYNQLPPSRWTWNYCYALDSNNSQLYQVQKLLFRSTVNCTEFNNYSVVRVKQSSVPNSIAIFPDNSRLYQVQQLLFRSIVNCTKFNSYIFFPFNSRLYQVQHLLSTVNGTKLNRYFYSQQSTVKSYCSDQQSTVPSSTAIVLFNSQLYQVQQLLFRSTVNCTKFNSYHKQDHLCSHLFCSSNNDK